jgi:hypothetical protein
MANAALIPARFKPLVADMREKASSAPGTLG